MDECLAQLSTRIDGAKYISACAVEETGNRAQSLTLRAFAAPRCAEEEISPVEIGTTIPRAPSRRMVASKLTGES